MATIGLAARLGLAGGEGDGVRFADAGVEEAIGKVGPHLFQLVALAHGRGHHGHERVVLHGLVDGGAGRVGVGLEPPRLSDTMVRLRADLLEDRRRVDTSPDRRWPAGRRAPLTVKTCSSTGPVLILHGIEPVAQAGQIVAVDRADVAEAEFLEEHAAGQEGLERRRGPARWPGWPFRRRAEAAEHLLQGAFPRL